MIKKEEEGVQEAEEEVDEEDDDEREMDSLELTPFHRKSLSLQCRYGLNHVYWGYSGWIKITINQMCRAWFNPFGYLTHFELCRQWVG